MSEDEVLYQSKELEDKSQLLFLSKRLIDIAKELEELPDDMKKYVVVRAEMSNSIALVELFNSLNEYMD